jgi:hypothetical protein
VFFFDDSRGTTCSVEANLPPSNLLLQAYGTGSRCLNHGRQWTVNGQSITLSGGGCYEVSLSYCEGKLGRRYNIFLSQFSCSADQVNITIVDAVFVCSCSQAGQEVWS